MEKSLCIVCEYGWIIKGIVAEETESTTKLKDASVVRRWTNGKGIGAIAKAENRNEYTLDPIGDVEILKDKVLFLIPCEW